MQETAPRSITLLKIAVQYDQQKIVPNKPKNLNKIQPMVLENLHRQCKLSGQEMLGVGHKCDLDLLGRTKEGFNK